MHEWMLDYLVADEKFESWESRTITFRAESEEDGLRRALRRLQAVMKRTERRVHLVILSAHPPGPTCEIYRIKQGWNNRRLLRISNPHGCFVRGAGPEALRKLGRL